MPETIWLGAEASERQQKLHRVRELYEESFMSPGELVERLLDEKLAGNLNEKEEETPDHGPEAQEDDE